MGSFLKFEKMITPIFIQIIFWLGFLGAILGGFFLIGYGFISDSAGMIEIGSGILLLFFGPIIIRIYCEILIVVFKLQGALIEIRDEIQNKQNKASFTEENIDDVI